MKNKIQYQIKYRILCKGCNHFAIPFIKMIIFRNSKDFVVAAYCQKCSRYIENIPRKDIETRKTK